MPGSSIITALLSSLCCITPVLAMIAGASGWAASFTWLEPARPYLVGVTVLVLGAAWYSKLASEKKIACNCATRAKPAFTQTKTFLVILTIVALVLATFPYYAHIFYPKTEKQIVVIDNANIQTTRFTISGMTCAGCEAHVTHEISKLSGIVSTSVSYKDSNAVVQFDNSKVNVREIEQAISRTGYTITGEN